MNRWPLKLIITLFISLLALGVANDTSAAQTVVTDSARVGLEVTGDSDEPSETATASTTPAATVTATATSDAGGSSSTVPAVSELPETGAVHYQDPATGVLLAALIGGALIMTCGLIRGGRADRR